MNRGTVVHIDAKALLHNFAIVKSLTKPAKSMAMLKCNAYGHGLIWTAKQLQEADAFGVACLSEAIELRNAGIDKPIVVFAGFQSHTALQTFLDYALIPVIHTSLQIDILENQTPAKIKKMSIWMKTDTGMHRLGFQKETFIKAYERLKKINFIEKPIGVMSHFATADDLTSTFTLSQIHLFKELTASLECIKSLSNSAGICGNVSANFDWVRPGIMLYGASPLLTKTAQELGLKPVMTLYSKLIAVKTIAQGEKVGYGGTFCCPETMPIGILEIGYGDGYPRHAINGTPILLQDQRCPLIGRVSMDLIAVDLRTVPHAKIGDQAILWGEGLPVEEVASCANTISYELLTGLNNRVLRKEL